MQVIVSWSVGGKTTNWRCGNRIAVGSYIVNGVGNGREVVGDFALGELGDAAMEQTDILVDLRYKIGASIAGLLLESSRLLQKSLFDKEVLEIKTNSFCCFFFCFFGFLTRSEGISQGKAQPILYNPGTKCSWKREWETKAM